RGFHVTGVQTCALPISSPLLVVILASWGVAFFEYVLQVPANRWGSAVYSAPQLKGMQEVITLVVFAVFLATYLGQSLKWNHWARSEERREGEECSGRWS